jgi:hypothetical protein
MGLSIAQYAELKRSLIDSEADFIRARPNEHTYVEYAYKKLAIIKDLDSMTVLFRETRQYNAMVGALKAKSEILDGLIEKGQEFGMIDKKPERKEIVAGIMVANLTSDELRQRIVAEVTGLKMIQDKYPESRIDEVDAGSIYRETPALSPAPAPAKVKAHARNPVHGGRKVVKTKA